MYDIQLLQNLQPRLFDNAPGFGKDEPTADASKSKRFESFGHEHRPDLVVFCRWCPPTLYVLGFVTPMKYVYMILLLLIIIIINYYYIYNIYNIINIYIYIKYVYI